MASIPLLVADAVSVIAQFIGQPEWGVYADGAVVPNGQVIGQGVTSIFNMLTGQGSSTQMDMEFEARWSITNAPQEGGAFMSYNRVQTPYRVVVTWVVGGTTANRALLLQQVMAIMIGTGLYTVLQPEGPVVGLNPVGYGYRRRPDDVGILEIAILFAQVRPAGDPTFSTISAPGTSQGLANAQGGASTTAITNPQPAFAYTSSQQSFGAQSTTTVPASVVP